MRYDRQTDIFNPENHEDVAVSIVGCGSVGSFTALALAKMGVKITNIYDSDTIEEHNLSNQFYPNDSIGLRKTDKLHNLLSNFSDSDIIEENQNINEHNLLTTKVVVSAVDSMAARKVIWERVKASPAVRYYIDSRMGGKVFTVYTVEIGNVAQMGRYETQLFPENELTRLNCTERTIIFNVLGVASIICNAIVRKLEGKNQPFEITFDYETYTLEKGD